MIIILMRQIIKLIVNELVFVKLNLSVQKSTKIS